MAPLKNSHDRDDSRSHSPPTQSPQRRSITPSPPHTHPLSLARVQSSTPPTSSEQLERLYTMITSVLEQYIISLNPSPIYVDALIQFRDRAQALSGPSTNDEQTTVGNHRPTSGASTRSRSASSMANGKSQHRARSTHGSSPGLTMTPHTIPRLQKIQTHSRPEIDLVALERLERDWWNSEIASIWYGPQPQLRPSRSCTPPTYSFPYGYRYGQSHSPSDGRLTSGNRRVSFGVLDGMDGTETKSIYGRNDKDGDEGTGRWSGGLRRTDASYVGLNDE
ncbi:hypothetical protein IAR55_003149 [Kwoniella newhampshirensis]|uniref:Uncharacterized protein n=1 Tax=Kwoniella newhampshirensis TaxID=1651941 RepID=A0AAW0YSK9_9TREE